MQAILCAALEVFSNKGFAAARLEDVAARAGVAKGTIYLYVESKEALFEALVHSAIGRPIEALEKRVLGLDLPAEMIIRALLTWMRQEVLGTTRQQVARLVLSEAGRFPAIAELYYREVVSRGMGLLRRVAEQAVERGEFESDALARFPQLAVAPALVAILWSGLFERFEPLDAEAMFQAHLDVLMHGLKGERP